MSTGYQIIEHNEIHYLTFQVVKCVDVFTREVYGGSAYAERG